ncbi:MAG: hypothetical protein EPO61_11215 [Nitrospirae bacterium]|nr:MAG: hypothetical protein EPO61_11215 [Nitrospirota bacterium]
MMRKGTWAGGALLALASLSACAPAVSPTSPFFMPDAADLSRYQSLVQAHETQLGTCAERQTCDRVHFTRALVALYENREAAVRQFQQVVAASPDSRLASSSRVWLHVLKEQPSGGAWSGPLARMTEQLVRDVLDRELAIQQLSQELDGPAIRTLQRGLKARDKQIEELTRQLDALKRIDQEMKDKEKRRPKPAPGRIPPASGKDAQP